jgi:hypothetical protein
VNDLVKYGVGCTRISLILPQDLTTEQLLETLKAIFAIDSGRLWWLGDTLLFNEKRKWGEMYDEPEKIGFAYQTAADAVWVAREFPFSRRRENLSWTHHRAVTSLDSADADRLLDEAVTNKWSVRELREQVSVFVSNRKREQEQNKPTSEPSVMSAPSPQSEPYSVRVPERANEPHGEKTSESSSKPTSAIAPSAQSEPSTQNVSSISNEPSLTSVPEPLSEPTGMSVPASESEPSGLRAPFQSSGSLDTRVPNKESEPDTPIVSQQSNDSLSREIPLVSHEAMNISLRAILISIKKPQNIYEIN